MREVLQTSDDSIFASRTLMQLTRLIMLSIEFYLRLATSSVFANECDINDNTLIMNR